MMSDPSKALQNILDDVKKKEELLQKKIITFESEAKKSKQILQEVRSKRDEYRAEVHLWTQTANANQQLLDDYKIRERDALEILTKMIQDYVEENVIFKQKGFDFGSRSMTNFKGLSKEKKVQLRDLIDTQIDEQTNFADKLRKKK